MTVMDLSAQSLVFVINSLTAGGAERALVNLIGSMEPRLKNCTTHLVLLDVEEERHPIPHFVHKHVLDARFDWMKSAYLLTRLLKRLSPAVTLSFLNRANVASIISSRILKHPCIISERAHTSSRFAVGAGAMINRSIVRFTYPLADQVIAVSVGVQNDLVRNFRLPEGKVRVIYNPVDIEHFELQASAPPPFDLPDAFIVSAGRLASQKNFSLLIEAYCAASVSEKLVILGEGDQRSALEQQVFRRGLKDRVFLPGHVQNPYPIIKAARLYVCSSDFEGFPNALIEAMVLGCPVVSTDCKVGPSEILQDVTAGLCSSVTPGRWGLLVPTGTVCGLAEAIAVALRPETRTMYAARGKERARDFSVEAAVDRYWSTLAPYLSH